jgi:GNAT superfamily N-acetyltransferase
MSRTVPSRPSTVLAAREATWLWRWYGLESGVLDTVVGAATLADVPAIHRLVAAAEQDLDGEVDSGLDWVAAVLRRPTLDLSRDTVLIAADRGEVAGWAMVHLGTSAVIHVHPAWRGHGYGTWLLDWAERRAGEHGSARLGQTVSDHDSAAFAILRARGYAPIATNWLLRTGFDTEPTVPQPPAGIVVRPFRPGDECGVYELIVEAFADWSPRRRGYPEWAAGTVERATFAPALSPLAYAGDRLVAAVLCLDVPGYTDGHVEEVAVDRGYRRQGLARLLLSHAFRAVYRHGRRGVRLWTHSDTGALPVYEKLGLRLHRSNTVYRRDLVVGLDGT